MSHEPNFVFIGDLAEGTVILVDPITGCRVSTAESDRDPFEAVQDPHERFRCAVALVEFALAHAPNGSAADRLLVAAHGVLLAQAMRQTDVEAKRNLRQLARGMGSSLTAASCVGIRHDPGAATFLAAAALALPAEKCLGAVLQNVQLMTIVYERERGISLALELDRLISDLASAAGGA